LLKLFTKKTVNEEMTAHIGHEKNQAEPGRETTNVRDGTRSKTVISERSGRCGCADEVPRDWGGTFEPRIVKRLYATRRGSPPVIGVARVVFQSTPQCSSRRSR
jgi:transposase-like protein